MTIAHGTYRDTESKTSKQLRDTNETRRVHCYRCGKSFISYQFEVRKCDKCKKLPDSLRNPEIYFNQQEMRNINTNYLRIMRQFGAEPCDIMGLPVY